MAILMRIRRKLLTLLLMAFAQTVACSSQPAEELAAVQALRFPVEDDIQTLDPAHAFAFADVALVGEVFAGLYSFDSGLKVLPALASGRPEVSPDGLNYTFHLRPNARFSNGDPVRADDVIYSWNRAAAISGPNAGIFDPVVGGVETERGSSKTIAGLTKSDDSTVQARLTAPAGYWLNELATVTAAVVDQRVVESAAPDRWWQRPETLVGAGPFKMVERSPERVAFEPVAKWWGGSTGALRRVTADIGIDLASAVRAYEAGKYDVVGVGRQSPDPDDVLRYRNHKDRASELTIKPIGRSVWAGINFTKGPLAGQEGKDGRRAFSQALDRRQLAAQVCGQGTLCSPATAGIIPKGLTGYLGDGADSNARFSPSDARARYRRWDPDGSKAAGLTYLYNSGQSNQKVAENLRAQWKSNLGVDVQLQAVDQSTWISRRRAREAILFRDTWTADFDSPADWLDNLFACPTAGAGRVNYGGYCNPSFDQLLARAHGEGDARATTEYQRASRLLVEDAAYAPLFYDNRAFLAKPYVRGAGFNALYDYRWEGIRILQH
jgi:oligopeptide transport system substrate-binding protein